MPKQSTKSTSRALSFTKLSAIWRWIICAPCRSVFTGSDSALLGFLATVNPTPGYAKLIRQDRHCVLKVQALVVIYALIAVPFRSYLKPLIFLLAAPVAWCGAVRFWRTGWPVCRYPWNPWSA